MIRRMKSTLRATLLIAAVSLLPAALSVQAAEVRLPQASPAASVKAALGATDITIDYHRPGVKGRKIWGGLVPFGEVWRLGANEATTISFSSAVRIEGHDVPAGKYALFALPTADSWTLILNKQAEQWGAYDYKKDQDLVRFDVKPKPGPATEWMLFTITPDGPSAVTVEMAWESLRVPFRVEADVQKVVWQSLDTALAGKPDAELYLQAANYALSEGKRLDDAMTWADKSIALQDGFWNHEIKARLLQKQGKVDEAVTHLDKAIVLAKGKAPQVYIDELEKLKGEWKKKA
jgi:tetratricopeptide (TPR) repeat protein